MSDPEVHIATWESAGLIDAPLAARLRATIPEPAPAQLSGGSAGSFFGPSITIGELFAYLGAAFVLGGWLAFIAELSSTSHPTEILAGSLAASALAMFGFGLFLARGDRRRHRAAGVAFLATIVLATGSAAYVVQTDALRNTLQDQAPGVLIALVAVLVAAGLRRVLPAVTTQVGLLLSLTSLWAAVLGWVQSIVYPSDFGDGMAPTPVSRPGRAGRPDPGRGCRLAPAGTGPWLARPAGGPPRAR